MDFLAEEIQRKKKEMEELMEKKRKESGEESQPKKYMRRGDIEKEKERKYLEEQEKVRIFGDFPVQKI